MLSFALMGPIEITLDQQPLNVYARAQGILAYLAMQQRRQFRRAELATLFWPDVGHKAAQGNQRYVLYRLRRALATARRQTSRTCWRLREWDSTPTPHTTSTFWLSLQASLTRKRLH